MKQDNWNQAECLINKITSTEKNIADACRERMGEVLIGFLFGCCTYFMLMANGLVNHLDGIWHFSNFVAGDWEISIGRGLQRYFDKMRYGLIVESLNTMLSLILILIAVELILELFGFRQKWLRYLVIGLTIASPTVCNSLTYSYLTVNFFLAFLFSVLAVYVYDYFYEKGCHDIGRHHSKYFVLAVVGGAVFIAMCMASYQAYFSVTCMLLLFVMFRKLLREDVSSVDDGKHKSETKNVWHFLGCSVAFLLCGGIFYYLLTQLLLWHANTKMATYKGVDGASLSGMILSLPSSIMHCYQQFAEHFEYYRMYMQLHFIEWLMVGYLVLMAVCVVWQTVRLFQKNRVNAIVFLIGVLLIPVACTAVLTIAVGNNLMPLMTMSLVLLIPLGFLFVPERENAFGSKATDGSKSSLYIGFCAKRIYFVLMLLFLWFGITTVTNDQMAIKEGKDSTVAITNQVIATLNTKGYLNNEKQIVLIGRPAENPLFTHHEAYQTANYYAQFGGFSVAADTCRSTWSGVIYHYCGLNFELFSDDNYDKMVADKRVADMPAYPAEGSVQEIDDVVVVKISDLYY